jgi:hypothetical protein
MQLPRPALLTVWVALTAAAYWLLLFTNVGNYFHGGTPLGNALLQALAVLALFSAFEVFRAEKALLLRGASVLLAAPLAVGVLLSLWHAINRYVAV